MKILDHGFLELVSKTGAVGGSVVDAARCSLGSRSDDLGERDRKLIAFLLGNGHTSPFRHAYFTFHIKAPLFVFRQWWKYQVGCAWREYETPTGETLAVMDRDEKRHLGQVVASDVQIDTDKGCSWNELSGRYKVMEPEFYVPNPFRKNTGRQAANEELREGNDANAVAHYMAALEDAKTRYAALLDLGVAKELARLVLPPSIYSEAYWTVSLQAVLHFLDQRLAPEAQFEIRSYAQGVLELLRPDLKEMGVEL
jgi:thymidylate synthase (FAD)